MNIDLIRKLHLQFRVPAHINAHMHKVAEVAVFIGRKINAKKGRRVVKINLLKSAALLHDILKVCEFKTSDPIFKDSRYDSQTKRIWIKLIRRYGGMGHIHAAESLLNDLHEPIMAQIIKKHDYSCLTAADPRLRPQTFEEKILYYSDKRVLHSNVVSLEYRFKEGRQRYQGNKKISPREAEIIKKARQLESELCKAAGIRQEDIN